jgi:hypothetical protein
MPSSPWPSSPDGLGLLNPEDESPIVLRNAGNPFSHTTSLSKDFSLRRHHRGNVKSRRRVLLYFVVGSGTNSYLIPYGRNKIIRDVDQVALSV